VCFVFNSSFLQVYEKPKIAAKKEKKKDKERKKKKKEKESAEEKEARRKRKREKREGKKKKELEIAEVSEFPPGHINKPNPNAVVVSPSEQPSQVC